MQSKIVKGLEIGVIVVIGIIVITYFMNYYVLHPSFSLPPPPEPIYPYIPIEFVMTLILGFATILGLITNYFWRSHRWNAIKSVAIIVVAIVLVTASMSIAFYNEERNNPPLPIFEKLELSDTYCSPTEIKILVKNVGIYTNANIADIFIDGMPLSAVNGTSDPRIPFILKERTSETVRLSFSSPLASGKAYEITLHTEREDYAVNVAIP